MAPPGAGGIGGPPVPNPLDGASCAAADTGTCTGAASASADRASVSSVHERPPVLPVGASEEIRPLSRCLGNPHYGSSSAEQQLRRRQRQRQQQQQRSKRKKSRWGPAMASCRGGGNARAPRLVDSSGRLAAEHGILVGGAPQQPQQPRRSRPRRWDMPPPPPPAGVAAPHSPVRPVRGPSMRDMPVGDDRTCEWEEHAEALALGLGLLDEDERLPPPPPAATDDDDDDRGADDADNASKAKRDTRGRTSVSYGRSRAQYDEYADGPVVAIGPPAAAASVPRPVGTSGRASNDGSSTHGEGRAYDDDGAPVVSIGGPVGKTGGEAALESSRKRRAAAAEAEAAQHTAQQKRDWAVARRAELQRQEQGQGQPSTPSENNETNEDNEGEQQQSDDDDDGSTSSDAVRPWYRSSDSEWPCVVTPPRRAASNEGKDGTSGVGNADDTNTCGKSNAQSLRPDASKRRKRSRLSTSASVSFALAGDGGRGGDSSNNPGSKSIELDLSPSSAELLADPAYIDLVCGPADGEACQTLLASLLDAMGMELPSSASSASSSGSTKQSSSSKRTPSPFARPMREGRKPVQTPGTVREFALTLISMGLSKEGKMSADDKRDEEVVTVLDEVAAAFRLACHHVLRYVAHVSYSGSNSSSKDVRRKKTKLPDFARRAYMTLFVTLRGLLIRIVDRADSEGDDQTSSSSTFESTQSFSALFAFFDRVGNAGNGEGTASLSTAEQLLLDIAPLLTRFSNPPLGEKHATSFLSNLLLLDETARKRKRAAKEGIVVVQDGLMELLVRQLVDQEGLADKKIRKLLNIPSTDKAGGVGAAAALRSEPSSTCLVVVEAVLEQRNRQKAGLEAVIAKTPGVSRNVSSSWDTEDAIMRTDGSLVSSKIDTEVVESSDAVDDDLRLVRIDGCIYLSKIAAKMMQARPQHQQQPQQQSPLPSVSNRSSSVASAADPSSSLTNFAASSELKNEVYEQRIRDQDDKLKQRLNRVSQTAYFLFHTLVESHAMPRSDGARGSRRLRRREVSSAVLGCYMLAGKMEDCPFKLKTIIRITKDSTLPPPPLEEIRRCYEKLAPQQPRVVPMKWGEPSADLIKQFELDLLTTLGFVMPGDSQGLHPIASIDVIESKLSLDSTAVKQLQDLVNDPCYTHSSLCLLREPQLMAAALYYISCEKGSRSLLEDWDSVLNEEAVVVKVIAEYAWWVRNCVRTREKQWNSFKILRQKMHPARACSFSKSCENVDDSLAKWSRTIPPISTFESPPPLPVELSTVTEKINTLLCAPDDQESSSPDEVKDEDYLTLAALLEIPDDAVESDQSPSTNSVDSIAVLMNAKERENGKANENGNNGCSSEHDDNGSIIVSPGSGDGRRVSCSSATSIAMEGSIKFDEKGPLMEESNAVRLTDDNVEKERAFRKEDGGASTLGPIARSGAAKTKKSDRDNKGTEPPAQDTCEVAVTNATRVHAETKSASGGIVTSDIQFSPIRRKVAPAKAAVSKGFSTGRKRKPVLKMPVLSAVATEPQTDTTLKKRIYPSGSEEGPVDDTSPATNPNLAAETNSSSCKLKTMSEATMEDCPLKLTESSHVPLTESEAPDIKVPSKLLETVDTSNSSCMRESAVKDKAGVVPVDAELNVTQTTPRSPLKKRGLKGFVVEECQGTGAAVSTVAPPAARRSFARKGQESKGRFLLTSTAPNTSETASRLPCSSVIANNVEVKAPASRLPLSSEADKATGPSNGRSSPPRKETPKQAESSAPKVSETAFKSSATNVNLSAEGAEVTALPVDNAAVASNNKIEKKIAGPMPRTPEPTVCDNTPQKASSKNLVVETTAKCPSKYPAAAEANECKQIAASPPETCVLPSISKEPTSKIADGPAPSTSTMSITLSLPNLDTIVNDAASGTKTPEGSSKAQAVATPRRAAAASSLLELKVAPKVNCNCTKSLETSASTNTAALSEIDTLGPPTQSSPSTNEESKSNDNGNTVAPDIVAATSPSKEDRNSKATRSTSKSSKAGSQTTNRRGRKRKAPNTADTEAIISVARKKGLKASVLAAASLSTVDGMPKRDDSSTSASTDNNVMNPPKKSSSPATGRGRIQDELCPESSLPGSPGELPAWYPAPDLRRLELQAKEQEPEVKASKDAAEAREYIHSRVAKLFDDVVYFGSVTDYTEESSYWHIEYDDGDEEDYDGGELESAGELYRKNRKNDSSEKNRGRKQRYYRHKANLKKEKAKHKVAKKRTAEETMPDASKCCVESLDAPTERATKRKKQKKNTDAEVATDATSGEQSKSPIGATGASSPTKTPGRPFGSPRRRLTRRETKKKPISRRGTPEKAVRAARTSKPSEQPPNEPALRPDGEEIREKAEKRHAVLMDAPDAAATPSIPPPPEPADEVILIDCDDDEDVDVAVAGRTSASTSVTTTPKEKAEFAAQRHDARRLFDFSSGTMNETKPLYNSSLRPVSDKEGMHLCCELGTLTRENAIHFIDVMKKKPDAFWLDKNVESKARHAFRYQLPPRVQPEDARHLFRNFADSASKECFKCPCTGPKRLRISRREMDIMLYFNSKGKTAKDCHYLMPYRSQRGLRRIFEAIKELGSVEAEYMKNVTVTVEKLEAVESPSHIEQKEAPCIETLTL